jgi:hypothetical protein
VRDSTLLLLHFVNVLFGARDSTMPPPDVEVGEKRGHVESDDEVASVHAAQTAKAQKVHVSSGRPKAKDYDDVTQEVLAIAIAIYRCLISTEAPFPDHVQEVAFAKTAWEKASEICNIVMSTTPEIIKMVRYSYHHCDSNLMGS